MYLVQPGFAVQTEDKQKRHQKFSDAAFVWFLVSNIINHYPQIPDKVSFLHQYIRFHH